MNWKHKMLAYGVPRPIVVLLVMVIDWVTQFEIHGVLFIVWLFAGVIYLSEGECIGRCVNLETPLIDIIAKVGAVYWIAYFSILVIALLIDKYQSVSDNLPKREKKD